MVTIKGVSSEKCFLTGKRDDVVEVKSKQFSGHVCWPELLKIVKRLDERTEATVKLGTDQQG